MLKADFVPESWDGEEPEFSAAPSRARPGCGSAGLAAG